MMLFEYLLLVTILNTCLQPSGAQGFHVQLETDIECGACGPNSRPNCRFQDCSVPVEQQILITCTLVVDCNPLSHPLRMLRITSSGAEEIRPNDVRGVMPGFVELSRPTDCSLQMTIVANADTNNVVLQCGVSTNETMEYSKATVLEVRGQSLPTEGPTGVSTGPPIPSPSPAITPVTTSSSTTEITSSSSSSSTTASDTDAQVTDCFCSAPTALPTSISRDSGTNAHSLSIATIAVLSLLSSVVCLYVW